MEATTYAEVLRDALAVSKRYVGSGKHFPAASILEVTAEARALTLRRTNVSEEVTTNFAATDVTPGSVRVEASALTDAIGKAKGAITLTADGERLTLRSGSLTASVPVSRNAADFPTRDTNYYVPFASIYGTEYDAMRGVLNAAANGSDARAVLTGVYFDHAENTVVATDTYRMHGAGLHDVTRTGIIPASAIGVALATGRGTITIEATDDGGRYALHYLRVKGTKKNPKPMYVRTTGFAIEGPYPDYSALVAAADESPTTWSVRDARGTADVLAGFANKTNVPVMIEAAGTAVRLTAAFVDGMREAIAPVTPTDGDAFTIALNPTYAAEAIAHSGDGATVMLRDGLRAARFDGVSTFALLMPMRVS